ncbi:MAG: ABC transporter substrate-binding protein [Dehalococcoidia bacterium]
MTTERTWWSQKLSRRYALRGGATLAASIAAASLLACSSDDSNSGSAEPTPESQVSSDAKPGGKMGFVRGGATANLNPVVDTGQRLDIGGQIAYDRLVSTRPGKDYFLENATSVEFPDNLTVVFKLKPNQFFHNIPPVNGRALTAEDVVASNNYVKEETRAINAIFQRTAMASATAPDANTVVFKLTSPQPYLFSGGLLVDPSGSSIFPKEIIGKQDEVQIGSGPYQLSDYQLNTRYQYKRFDKFRDADKKVPFIDERTWLILVDNVAQEAAFRSEQISQWRLPESSTTQKQLQSDLGSKVEVDEYLALQFIGWLGNVTRAPWNDVRVREAVYRLLDRNQHLQLVHEGRGAVPAGLLPYGQSDYQLDPKQTEKYFKQDVAAAKQLLNAASFPFDKEFEVSQTASARDAQLGQVLQVQFEQAGIKTRVQGYPFAQWLPNKIGKGDYDMYISGLPAWDAPQIPLRFNHTTTNFAQPFSGLKDPAIDKLIEKSEVTLDKEERVKLVKDIQLQLMDKYTPYINVYNYKQFIARYAYVRDFIVDPSGNPNSQGQMWLNA